MSDQKLKIQIKKPNLKFTDKLVSGKMFSLIKREISNYFSTPVGFIVFSLFVIAISTLLFAVAKYIQYGTADLTQLFTFIAFVFVIIIPALTMGSISREKQTGTIEYILTQPITELQYLISKFVSYGILVFVMLLTTLPLTIIIGTFAGLDAGQVIMQYIGAYILGLCFVAIGLCSSAFFKSEISAFLMSVIISAVFIIFGTDIFGFLPAGISTFLERFSLLSHYQSISRGVLDFRDVLYFIAFLIGFIVLTYYLIIKDKYPKKHKYLRNIQIATAVVLLTTFVIGFIGQIIPGRIDFTSDKKYTLSEATTNIIGNVKDVLNITLYASSNLPAEFQGDLRNINDVLRDYSTSSNGKIHIETKQPDKDDNVLKEAKANGITEIKFNVNTTDSAQVVVGYFGVTFKYLDKTDSLNFNNQTINDLEFQITKKIKKIANISSKKIAFVDNNVAHSKTTDLQSFAQELGDIYEVSDLTLTKDNPTIPQDVNAIIISTPNAKFDDVVIANIKKYFDNGGSVFLMSEPIQIQQDQTIAKNENSLKDLFANYGVTVDENLVYDLKNNNIIALQTDFAPQIINYPLWVVASATKENISILKEVPQVSSLWASNVSVDSSKLNNAKVYPLLRTSNASNIQNLTTYNLAFDQKWAAKNDDGVKTIAVALENAKGGRAVVMGDSDYLIDDMLSALNQRQGQDKLSIAFALNSISWLSKDDAIGSIKSKNRVAAALQLDSFQEVILIAGSTLIPLAVILSLGGVKYYLRSRLLKKSYTA